MVCYLRKTERDREADSKIIDNLFQIYSETEGHVQDEDH